MADLALEIKTYETEKTRLQKDSLGKFVLVKGTVVEGTYDTFEAAAEAGTRKFGEEPFLVREVGSDKADIPTAVMYGLTNADNPHVIYNHR